MEAKLLRANEMELVEVPRESRLRTSRSEAPGKDSLPSVSREGLSRTARSPAGEPRLTEDVDDAADVEATLRVDTFRSGFGYGNSWGENASCGSEASLSGEDISENGSDRVDETDPADDRPDENER
jgi:hypothetical protein